MKNANNTVAAPVNAIAAFVATAPAVQAAAAPVVIEKKPRTVRAAQKPVAAPVESIVAKSARVIAIKHVIAIGRPVAGRLLAAHTEAVLELLGMYNGKSVPRETLVKIIGTRAVSYHLTQQCTFEMNDDGITLSGFGQGFFGVRKHTNMFDPQDVAGYKAILTTGKADDRLIKNQAHIKAI